MSPPRVPRNRVIRDKNASYQLQHHPIFQFKRNRKYKTIYGYYKGIEYYFTAQKRNGRNDTKEMVFIESNV